MLNPEQLIQSINTKCKSFFQESFFKLTLTSRTNSSFFYRIEGTSFALNLNKNNPEKVKVLRWFENFWLFIEIRFIENYTLISISVFQGDEQEETKHQLFRAEWDDYNNPEETHPQPHWHIISGNYIDGDFNKKIEDEEISFSTFEAVKSKIVDIKRIHFAMNGNWQNGESYTYYLDDNEKILKWLQGLLIHIRNELEFVK